MHQQCNNYGEGVRERAACQQRREDRAHFRQHVATDAQNRASIFPNIAYRPAHVGSAPVAFLRRALSV